MVRSRTDLKKGFIQLKLGFIVRNTRIITAQMEKLRSEREMRKRTRSLLK